MSILALLIRKRSKETETMSEFVSVEAALLCCSVDGVRGASELVVLLKLGVSTSQLIFPSASM